MAMLENLSDRDWQDVSSSDVSEAASGEVVSLDAKRGKLDWEKEIVGVLCRYVDLPQGWDSYQGKPLRHDTGMFALQVLSNIMNESIPPPSVVPVSSGGVQFEWHQNGLDIEFYIAAPFEGELSVYDHTTDEPPQIEMLSTDLGPLARNVKRLVNFNRHLNNHANAG